MKLRVLALGLGLVAVAAAGGEWVLEYFGFGAPILVEQNPLTGYEMRPDQHSIRRMPMSSDPVAHIEINHEGMRSRELGGALAGDGLRVMFLGDSITYGSTQVDQENLFSERVGRDLSGRLGRPVVAMNVAASAWAIGNEFGWLKEHGTYGADWVLLCLNSGDPEQPFADFPKDGHIEEHPYGWPRGYGEFVDRAVPSLVNIVRARLIVLRGTTVTSVPTGVDAGAFLIANHAALVGNLALLTQIQSFLADRKARLAIVYIPMVEEVRSPEIARTGHEAVKEWAAAHSVPFLDVMGSQVASELPGHTLRDGVHYDSEGHRLIATAIEAEWWRLEQKK